MKINFTNQINYIMYNSDNKNYVKNYVKTYVKHISKTACYVYFGATLNVYRLITKSDNYQPIPPIINEGLMLCHKIDKSGIGKK